ALVLRRTSLAVVVVLVVDVVDHRGAIDGVVHVDVGDVDATVVVAVAVVPRVVDLARAEREPAHRRAADAHRHAPAAAAHEGHQRRRIHRACHDRPRDPAPGAADVRPAAVVVGREAPRRIVHPGPTPRRDVGPVAVAVRRPVRRHLAGVPDRAVVGAALPAAVLVEVLVADHVVGYVATRLRSCVALVALAAPRVEGVAADDVADRQRRQRGVVELVAAALENVVLRVVLAVDRGLAVEHGDAGAVAAVVHVHAEGSGAGDYQCQRGRVDLVALALVEVAHAEVQRALGQLHLGEVVVEVEQAEVGAAGHAQHAAAQLQFGTRTVAGGEAVAGGQRPVEVGAGPVLAAGG